MVLEASTGIRCLDLQFQGYPGVVASFLIEDAGEIALIETGPSSCLDVLIEALHAEGVDPAEISKLIVTHIHLDHSGAAGVFMRRFPRASLYVHEIGAPHLIDPSRLLASATRIYGDRMGPLWGEVEPVSADRLTTLVDGDTVTVGKRRLDVIYTPGHAIHHVVLHDPESRSLLTGDVAACRLQGMEYVRPPTPPPDLDLDAWRTSIGKMQALRPHVLYLTHFGPFADTERHLEETERRLGEWNDVVGAEIDKGRDALQITDALRTHADRELMQESDDPETIRRYEMAAPYGMSVDGFRRYYRKR